MANIDELHFQVILDDSAFQQKIQTIEQAAQKLNTTVTNLLQIQAKITAASNADVQNARAQNKILLDNKRTQEAIRREVERTALAQQKNAIALQAARDRADSTTRATETVNREREARAIAQSATAMERLHRASVASNGSFKMQSKIVRDMIAMMGSYISIMGATRLVKNLVAVSAEFELQRTTLRAILGDAQEAEKIFGQIKSLAVTSPFQFKELATYAKQLSAYSIPVNELYDTTKMLADVSAGLGVDMNRLVLAYGQIRSASFLRGQEVRQLTEAGIPILEELRKQFKAMNGLELTAGDVFDKISARQVPFEMVAKVFKEMTSEGGKFYKMQEIQAETLKGKISNLTDAFHIMFSEIGEKKDGFLKGSVDAIRSLATNYEKVGTAILGVVTAMGSYKASMAVMNVMPWVSNIATITSKLRGAGIAANFFSVAAVKLGLNLKKLAIGGAIGALTSITAVLIRASMVAKEFNKELYNIRQQKFDEAKESVNTFNNLKNSLNGVAQGSEKYRKVIDQLNRQFGEYLPNLLTEKTTLTEIEAISNAVTASIYNRARAYAYESSMQKINDEYLKKSAENVKDLTKYLTYNGANDESAAAFIAKFREEISKVGDASQSWEVFKKSYLEFFKREAPYEEAHALTVRALGKAFVDVANKSKEVQNQIDAMFSAGSSFSTEEEMRAVKEIEDQYAKWKDEIDGTAMSQKQYNEEIKRLDISRLTDLIDLYERLGESSEDKTRFDMIKKYKAELATLTKEMTGWRKKADDLLLSLGMEENEAGGLWAKETDSFIEYIDNLRKAYKNLPSAKDLLAIKSQDESQYKSYVKQKEAIEALGKVLGVTVNDKIKADKGKTPAQVAIESQIEALKSYMTTYKEFKALGFGDNAIREIFEAYTDLDEETRNTLNFADALNKLADELENVYGETKAAGAVRRFVSGKDIKDITDGYNKLVSLRDKMQDILTQDFNIGGKGIVFDINKLAADLTSKNNKVDLNFKELKEQFAEAKKNEESLKVIREKYGHEAWAKYLDEGESALRELADKEKGYNEDVAMERVRDLAKNYVNEWEGLASFDLSNWGHKTIRELNAIKDVIEDFDVSQLPEDLVSALLGADGSNTSRLNEFVEAFKKALDVVGKKTDQQIKDETLDRVKKAAKAFGELADTGSRIAEAFGDTSLGTALTMMKEMANTASEVLEAYASGDYITMFIAIGTQILKIAETSITAIQEQKRAIAEAREEARMYKEELSLEDGIETLFGSNSSRSLQNAVEKLKEIGKLTDEDRKKTTLYNQAFDAKSGILSLNKNQRKFDLRKAVEDLGYDLTDEYGNLNATALQAILDTYKNLDAESRDWLTHAINDSELYAKAMEQLQEVVKDVFGNLADDMADALIDKYLEIGDATADLAENMDNIFSDLAQSIAKNLVSAFILDNVLAKYKGEVEGLYRQMGEGALTEEQIAEYFGTIAEGIKKDTETAAEFTNRLLNALKEQGIAFAESEGSNGLANGIQGVTEDTANLLASYINAIRADVSASRVTLTDIQTNTFRSAIAAEGILARMESVIGSFSGGGDGIKVVMQ